MQSTSRFRFMKSRHVARMTALHATMNDFQYDRHAHEEYALGVTLAGRQDFFSNGEFHRSPPGSVITLHPDEVHDGHAGGGDALDYVMLYIHPDELDPLIANAMGVQGLQAARLAPTLTKDVPLRDEIIALSRMIEEQETSQIEQEYALYRIAARLAERAGNFAPNERARRPDSLLERAKDFIHENARYDISLDDISHAASISKYHFLRAFRTQYGITPHQYVLNCRVNAARRHLENGESVMEAALCCGFADLSHFNRRFKRIYGMTPRQYQAHIFA
ncbi:AraC family transcriptional regulator [Chromohalobacter israelensis]|uniref:Transcriptional regulator, AraC family n=1 Tax=Chromohalobacter israelensis (strain ATCC BAA-138 / DSM 3043 / CIP 106854 / NCIMB 13768 / 1H11) TaxID=290398 RepID=Q1QTZ2_CHRI1|nr:transcriptional regulator, AraC family [Chromohalobacter salexigens DSM 3043]NQY45032.1 AraC family transcriptional regulator [Chromohalobacter sp.]